LSRPRFLIDECLSVELAGLAWRRGYQASHLHAGLVCIHGPPEGFTKAEQLEAFAVALDLIEQHGSDATNLLVEVVWAADGISYEVAEFPPGA